MFNDNIGFHIIDTCVDVPFVWNQSKHPIKKTLLPNNVSRDRVKNYKDMLIMTWKFISNSEVKPILK